jgi:hypothetical protein
VTGLYNPKAFIVHAASHRRAFAHCGCLSTAASLRSLGRISVPVWLTTLSGQLPIIALVSRYLTNKLIGLVTILKRHLESEGTFDLPHMRAEDVMRNLRLSGMFPTRGQISQALLTSSPLYSGFRRIRFAFDLHA